MKKQNAARYIVLAAFGAVLLAGGIILALFSREAPGIMKTLPYICVGVGAGIFGGNLGTAIKLRMLRRNMQVAKQVEIEEQDERNSAIRDKAKSRAYDIMLYVYGVLMVSFALFGAELYVLFSLIAAYLFIIGTNIYYINKLNNEM